jgi:predicted unusual protein kinase regulating ubiquinone biosynthesis (AarF/ABC1/UbiB family)
MKKLKKIKDSFVSRQLATAKLSIKTAKGLVKNRNKESLKETLRGTFQGNIQDIVDELDLMKGSLMKAGQMLSLFGGAFLPDELTAILKKLENQSSFLDWEEIKKQIPSQWHNEISIEKEPLASASLGQVHIATYNGQEYCMKIQYRGVRKAINNDIRALKILLKLFNFVPSQVDLKSIFKEIKDMLLLETDYLKEASNTETFKELLKGDEAFIVPSVLKEFSNEKILTTEYLKGRSLHDLDKLDLSQEERNKLGRDFMRLFLLEVFVFEKVQTDAHFGNYLVMTGEKPCWGLIDFGATKEIPKSFLKEYQKLILALRNNSEKDFIDTIYSMGYLSKDKDSDLSLFWEYAQLIGSPFIDDDYCWGKTNLSDQVMEYIPKIMKSVSVGSPPADTLFLDKKLGGVFFVLQKLEAKFNLNELFDEILILKKEDKSE